MADFNEFEAACLLAGLKIFVPRGGNDPTNTKGRWVTVYHEHHDRTDVVRVGLELAAAYAVPLNDCQPKHDRGTRGRWTGKQFWVRKSAFGDHFDKLPPLRVKKPRIPKAIAKALASVAK
jgi:hypothetical protein